MKNQIVILLAVVLAPALFPACSSTVEHPERTVVHRVPVKKRAPAPRVVPDIPETTKFHGAED